MDKYITHKAYVWVNNFNKYKANLLKDKTEEQAEEIINKIIGETDKLIEELKTVIDKNILEDIEREDNPKRCFLIIGGDEDLIEGIVSYIFCYYLFKGKLFFCSYNFTGNDDRTIKEKLINASSDQVFINQISANKMRYFYTGKSYSHLINLMNTIEADGHDLLQYFKYGGTLFLRNLKSQDHEMLKCIAAKIRDIVTKNDDSHGTLIVSTDNKDNLSDYFKAQFEIINLNLELKEDGKAVEGIQTVTQPQPSSQNQQTNTTETQQLKSEPEGGTYNWSINNEKREVLCNGKLITKLSNILFKLFSYLYQNKGKFVNNKTLEKCWDKKPDYDKFLVDTMNKLEHTLEKELKQCGKIKGKIIESKNKGRKIAAYRLPT